MSTAIKNNTKRTGGIGLLLPDFAIAALLAITSAVLSAATFRYLDQVLYGLLGIDFWFQSDMTRVFYNMTGVESSHYRASVHPLFSLIIYHLGFAVKYVAAAIFHAITDEQTFQLINAAVAGTWMACLYILLRLLTLRRIDATLFSLLGALSAASLFWFSVPETYSFGSLTILLALIVAVVHQRRAVSEGWFVAVSAATLSITVTNWMAGLAATFLSMRIPKAIRVSVLAFAAVYLLWMLEKYLFPSAGSFLHNSEELNYLFREETGGPVHILISFFSTTVVMPQIELIGKLKRPDWLVLSVQHSFPWRSGVLATMSFCVWLPLLCLGLKQLLFGSIAGRIRLLFAAVLAGQLALHLLYGEETFLYALHFLPLLIVTAALAATGPFRRTALALAAVLLITAGTNNIIRFREARRVMIQQFYPDRANSSSLPIQTHADRRPGEFMAVQSSAPSRSITATPNEQSYFALK
jgi:hypothetical protein